MIRTNRWILGSAMLLAFGSAAAEEVPTRASMLAHADMENAADDVGPRRGAGRIRVDPYALVSEDVLFSDLQALTTIRPFAGWRNSASSGEAEAIDYVAGQLGSLRNLAAWGLQLERQSFHTFTGTEFRETRVELDLGDGFVEVPAFGISGHRDDLNFAIAFDSDGVVNDSRPDPVVVTNTPYVVLSEDDFDHLPTLSNRIVMVDYALIDRSVLGRDLAAERAGALLDADPAGIVPVTSFSNVNGESHGSFAGDLPAFISFAAPLPPILNIRLEDLGPAGIRGMGDLEEVLSVRVTWDMDVYSPGSSEYLVARIPGTDSGNAVILGAHIDSPNNPGGVDDGSGAVSLLQVARVLDAARMQPRSDLYLAWFGSHERGLYGSAAFTAQHQELLDRTLAMLQVDCISVPLDGLETSLLLETWSFRRVGSDRMPWPYYLRAAAADHDIDTFPYDNHGLVSDNSHFSAWNVPNADLSAVDLYDATEVHYAGHMHDPYDTADLVRREADTLRDMATVALTAALQTGRDKPQLRVAPAADRRVVFVGSHTEAAHMGPGYLVEFSMTLAWNGLDVDLIPYGQAVTAEDLADAAMVVVLPVHDYPSFEADVELYDEAFAASELQAIERYVRDGGRLVITNSAHRLKYLNYVFEANEDWSDMNALANRFQVEFEASEITADTATVVATHAVTEGVSTIAMARTNAVPITAPGGRVLARADGVPVLVSKTAGAGELLFVGDLGILGNDSDVPENRTLWSNLAQWARSR